ncbi:CDP-glycerol glycerophosphotransferase family protein [Streptococcus suis]|uniref:Cps25N n=1 Tax=Streptococcus suis TaxID=1307 RepID=G8DUC1_STRSU|nr:CDP-glycerol glycerophosphotransferase family protein [Streptococcus suis]AEH57622.1 Cps25N [Streptococcus suis]NQM09711.1 teichoic acid biosynthesis protein B [Streptococcus suis]NQO93639.1 teichoic acid biosynthesis protein B [Streptococcus suis]CYU55596.1 CDP-glycerol:poly(glycerophosphate) glycerophosphotransferase [Streptococcus suis]HEM3169780.1 CDP-glycerol glycerophosphotransferase family protein [Streptococcus suis 89-3576-3]
MIIKDIIFNITTYIIAKIFFRKKYWLISERGIDARDNGYWFFKYLREQHPHIDAVYVIDTDSPDYDKVAILGKTVRPNSFLHGILFYASDKIIGTHPGCGQPKWKAIYRLDKLGFTNIKGKRIFLQHGIIKDKIPGLMKGVLETDLFICGAKPEYQFVLQNFGFSNNVIKYTGLARYDNLESTFEGTRSNKILLMPTWRHYLSGISKKEFLHSEYYIKYNEIINSKDLEKVLIDHNFELIFYPHYEIQKMIGVFNASIRNVTIAKFEDYDVQDLLKNADILVTDYSSVFFDMAYMFKETIFYQFDYEEYRRGHYQEGYFEYEDSFGPVVRNFEQLLQELIKFLDMGTEEKYTQNMKKYFIYRDNNNCNRIYSEIVKVR